PRRARSTGATDCHILADELTAVGTGRPRRRPRPAKRIKGFPDQAPLARSLPLRDPRVELTTKEISMNTHPNGVPLRVTLLAAILLGGLVLQPGLAPAAGIGPVAGGALPAPL